MALITYGGGKPQAATHSTTASYKLAKIHWSAPKKGGSITVTDGSGVLVATVTDIANDIMFNPPKSVTGLIVNGHGAGFLHVITQDISSFGG